MNLYNRRIAKIEAPNLNKLHNIAKVNIVCKLNQNLQ